MIDHRKKEYIKNCTGADCKREDSQKLRIFSRALFYILLAAFVATVGFVALFSPYFKITTINIQGNSELESSLLKQVLENSLEGNYAGIISKNNYLFMSAGRAQNILKNSFKKIKTVTAVKTFPDTLNVSIEEYSALLVWCSGDKCYLVDESGVAYNQVDFSSPEIVQNHLIRINDTSSQAVVLEKQVVDPAYASYVLGLKESFSKMNIALAEDGYQTPSRMAEQIDAKTVGGTQLFFSTQYSLDSAVSTLDLILKKQIPADDQNNVAYIDLRSEGKAFYKMNGQDLSSTDASSSVQPAVADTSKTDVKKK